MTGRRCADCGTELGELHLDDSGDTLCRGCLVRRPGPRVDERTVEEEASRNGSGPSPRPASAHGRLRRSAVDLLTCERRPLEVEPGAPYLPQGMFTLLAAPAKTGKSLLALVSAVDGALAGRRWVILDRENGTDEYARRMQGDPGQGLTGIAEARALTGRRAELVRSGVAYHPFPTVPWDDDADALDYLRGFHVVVFDSSRRFQSALTGADENSSTDYAQMVEMLVMPLKAHGVTVLILDNTGHEEQGRARGTSAKGDLPDLALIAAQETTFSAREQGAIRITVDRGRAGGHVGPWRLQLGGGMVGKVEDLAAGDTARSMRENLRRACVAALEAAGGPLGRERLTTALREQGVKRRNDELRDQLAELVSDPASGVSRGPDGYLLDTPTPPGPDSGPPPGHPPGDPPGPAAPTTPVGGGPLGPGLAPTLGQVPTRPARPGTSTTTFAVEDLPADRASTAGAYSFADDPQSGASVLPDQFDDMTDRTEAEEAGS